MGRPPSEDGERDSPLQVRLHAWEREELDKKAAAAGYNSTSTWLREMALGTAKPKRTAALHKTADELEKLAGRLRKLGA